MKWSKRASQNSLKLKSGWSCFLFLFFGAIGLQSQSVFQTYVAFDYKNQSLESIFDDLQSRHGIIFSYGDLNVSQKASSKFKGSLESGIRKLCQEAYISVEILGNHVILKNAPPKGRKIKGRIIDEDTQLPLVGATVRVLNAAPLIGTDSDGKGYFEIEGLSIGRYDFQFQYLG